MNIYDIYIYIYVIVQFNSQVQNKRYPVDSSQIPFEYCYELRLSISNSYFVLVFSIPFQLWGIDFHFIYSPNQVYEVPSVNLTMKGGDQYFVTNPIKVVKIEVWSPF
jgi:hypothetical protein